MFLAVKSHWISDIKRNEIVLGGLCDVQREVILQIFVVDGEVLLT